jgi:hypothetical protein
VATSSPAVPSGAVADAADGVREPGDSGAAAEATIWAVEPMGDGRRQLFVSLLVREADASGVAAAASSGGLRLALLGADG